MIIKTKPDKQKSESLKEMAEITIERLKGTDMEKYVTNTLLDYYDAIHKLLEALTIKNGVKIKGEGAHQELIEYLAKKRHINEQERQFLQKTREYRNRISYEGFRVNKNYLKLNEETIKKIIRKLLASLRLD